MNKNDILQKIREIRVMPLFYHPDAELSRGVMKAVFDGGVDILEFTNRGDKALPVFREIMALKKEQYPGAALGIGSITDGKTAKTFIDAGADFVVSPLLNKGVLEVCHEQEILCIPGCSTLTEINQAETWGAEMVKVFPALQLGGPAYIKAIKGPCPWLSIVVTGGVRTTREDLSAWHKAGAEAFGLGSDLLSKELVEKGDFGGLKEKILEIRGIISGLS